MFDYRADALDPCTGRWILHRLSKTRHRTICRSDRPHLKGDSVLIHPLATHCGSGNAAPGGLTTARGSRPCPRCESGSGSRRSSSARLEFSIRQTEVPVPVIEVRNTRNDLSAPVLRDQQEASSWNRAIGARLHSLLRVRTAPFSPRRENVREKCPPLAIGDAGFGSRQSQDGVFRSDTERFTHATRNKRQVSRSAHVSPDQSRRPSDRSHSRRSVDARVELGDFVPQGRAGT